MDKVVDIFLGDAKTNVYAALFVLTLFIAAYLYRDKESGHKDHQTALKEQRDAADAITKERIAEAKAMTSALEQSAQANIILEKSADERTTALRHLAEVVASLVQKEEVSDRRLEAVEQSVQVIRDAMLRLQGAPR